MFSSSRRWIRPLRSLFSARKRPSGGSRRYGSALRAELLEDRMMLTIGQPDPSFGVGGKILTDFVGDWDSAGRAAALQADGRLVVAGYAGTNGTRHAAMARLQPDGSLDPSFGNGGLVTTD